MTKHPKKPDRFWDRIARFYDWQTHRDNNYTEAAERIAQHLTADDVVLDYACGTGVMAFKVAPKVKKVLAIDTSAKMVALGKKRAKKMEIENVRFAQQSIFDKELATESFDVILAFNILHLVEQPQAVLEQARGLLKPGGRLISLTPCVGEAGKAMKTLLSPIAKVLGISRLRNFELSDVKQLFENSSFETLKFNSRGNQMKLCDVVARKN